MNEILDTIHQSARILADLLIEFDIRDLVISPGSRNTPLIIAAEARKSLHKLTVIDERAAAFYALGRALITQRPVALVCTSGTAMLNYAPAVAEAYYRGIPLIVISADRPMQWIDQDDSQTIRQPGALTNIVKKSYDIPVISEGNADNIQKIWLTNRLINDALIEATSGRKGPVHINIQFDGKLGGTIERISSETDSFPQERKIDLIATSPELGREVAIELARQFVEKRVLIIAGFMLPSDKTQQAIERISRFPNVYVMAETISNLKLPQTNNAIDTILSSSDQETLKEMSPDIVITLGGALVSRMIKEYLRSIRNLEHWSVGFQHTTVDCFTALTKRIEAEPRYFLNQLATYGWKVLRKAGRDKPEPNTYSKDWEMLKDQGLSRLKHYLDEAPWSDLKAYSILFNSITSKVNLFLSNGTSIRYAQLLMEKLPHVCHCNRGVSGIDGTTATAIGGASAYAGETIFVTGDMSLLYDPGALALDSGSGRMLIIIINNSGGGIFRFIDSTRNIPARETYLSPSPDVLPKDLAQTFNWQYYCASDERGLCHALADIKREAPKRAILEIKTGDGSPDTLRKLLKK